MFKVQNVSECGLSVFLLPLLFDAVISTTGSYHFGVFRF